MHVSAIPYTICLALAGGLIVFLTEWARRRTWLSNEHARKTVHMLHTVTIILWLLAFATYTPLIIAEIVFTIIVLLARYRNDMAGLRTVDRITYGEFLMPIGIIVLCLLRPTHTIFAVCVLQLGLADAAAAIVGTGVKSVRYKVFGHTKSVAGTVTFFATSFVIFFIYLGQYARFDVTLLSIIALASIMLAVVENLSPYGSDNLTVPLLTYLLITVGIFN